MREGRGGVRRYNRKGAVKKKKGANKTKEKKGKKEEKGIRIVTPLPVCLPLFPRPPPTNATLTRA